MKRNIKDILKENDTTLETPTLPKGHRAEFLEKLSVTEKAPIKRPFVNYWKNIAAACVLVLGVGAFIYSNYSDKQAPESPLLVEMKAIEDEYLQHISTEWRSFEMTANDEHLVTKYKERLKKLDASYQELKQEFLVQKNSLTILDRMIQNLQIRLTLLQEIQQHLKRLEDEQKNI